MTPLFRVTTRRIAGGTMPARAIGLGGSTIAVGVATGFLLLYVVLWTLATRGGFYRDELRDRIREVRIERAELDATKHRLQSPDSVLERAGKQMDMVPAKSRVFADLSGRAAAPSSGR